MPIYILNTNKFSKLSHLILTVPLDAGVIIFILQMEGLRVCLWLFQGERAGVGFCYGA